MKEKHLYEFGAFHLDAQQKILLREGERIALHPKTFAMLLALVEGCGAVISKDELLEKVWPDTFVEESNLTKNISVLRKALSNGHDHSDYIETIPTVGYRFVEPVRRVEKESGSAGTTSLSPSPPPPPSPARRWLWGLALAVLLCCITAFLYFRRTPAASASPASIAVLPFKNLTGDVEQDYFTDGLAEDLTNDLARLKDLKVIARNSAFTFKGQDVDVREAGRKLGVAAILEGTVQRLGERWQITATLRESQTGRVVAQ